MKNLEKITENIIKDETTTTKVERKIKKGLDRIKLADYCAQLEPGKKMAIYVLSDQQLQTHSAYSHSNTSSRYIEDYQQSLEQTTERLSEAGVDFITLPYMRRERSNDLQENQKHPRIHDSMDQVKADVCGEELGLYLLGCPCCVKGNMVNSEHWDELDLFPTTKTPGILFLGDDVHNQMLDVYEDTKKRPLLVYEMEKVLNFYDASGPC